MRTLVVILGLLFSSVASAETVIQINGWRIVSWPTGEPLTQYYGEGTYLMMNKGPVYKLMNGAWTYQGTALPLGFPQVEFIAGGWPAQLVIVPPAMAMNIGEASESQCGIHVGAARWLIDTGNELIGPYTTTAAAQTYATKHCQGSYSIVPVRP